MNILTVNNIFLKKENLVSSSILTLIKHQDCSRYRYATKQNNRHFVTGCAIVITHRAIHCTLLIASFRI